MSHTNLKGFMSIYYINIEGKIQKHKYEKSNCKRDLVPG